MSRELSAAAETFVARLDRVSKDNSIDLFRQQINEAGDVITIEFPPARKLPEDRPELRPERGKALGQEIADPFRAFAQA